MKTMLREFGFHWCSASREALVCLGMSMTDPHRAGLWWRSALLSLAVTHLWLFLYYYYSDLSQSAKWCCGVMPPASRCLRSG